ncbi:hypothetical protein AJ78_08002 [Emergomyces pasteurianus Ep9510]|uniref:Uncharacterized protein n=1 Tax=Emergomyces pasteurianus Ep9510 TaxID=1447872 RepID=A0A1J9P5L2_9EURO|nr:hypothetical protein AJ78_08002 [Emergomyces pasteurianus Ep9510]
MIASCFRDLREQPTACSSPAKPRKEPLQVIRLASVPMRARWAADGFRDETVGRRQLRSGEASRSDPFASHLDMRLIHKQFSPHTRRAWGTERISRFSALLHKISYGVRPSAPM